MLRNVAQDRSCATEADVYSRFKADMWSKIAEEMILPWRAAEAMHWQIGELEMARRAGVTAFSLSNNRPMPPRTNSFTASMRGDFARTGPHQLPSLVELTAGLPRCGTESGAYQQLHSEY
jgi:hypothetical protein